MTRTDDGEIYRTHADALVALATTLVGPSAAADVVSSAVARTIASPGWGDVDDRYAYSPGRSISPRERCAAISPAPGRRSAGG